ncbi:B12 binding protein [Chthoniobacter flavus]|uniref:B12-binding domain-containing radical SAM protein n=1 Tax=Chthoniobacter flavus TaxID=191863 RepID=UPI0010492B31|nr:radical SAM protein [Chthoniobacter flavus]TCO95710.1 B12 binding protein [Chthoniobacter flavus]
MKQKRIGFIAMSGVRAQNAELLAAGLTLPGFIERSKVIASLPSLSLLTLAGLTPPSFHIEYHEIADLRALGSLPTELDLVALTSLSAQIYDAYAVADHYRALGIPVVMGGLHVTSLPDEALEHATAIVIGEGEPLWPRLLADFDRGSLQRIYRSEEHGAFDLREAPMPRFDLLDLDKYNRITVQTSRGCPHKCEFCASSILLTPRYKLKPIEKVIAEIQAIKRLWPRPFIEFADDNNFVRRDHYKSLLRALAREKVRWFTEADLRVAEDDDLLGLMRDSGCQQVLVGLESPRRASLDGLETAANWKLRRHDRYLAAIERIQSKGVTVNGCFILGLDGDTPEVFDEVLRFVRQSGLYEVQVTFLTPFPGTPLYHRLKAEGRILRDRAWDLCTLFDINLQPRQMSVAELQSGFMGLVKELYSAEETATRRRNFKRRYRTQRRQTPRSELATAA